MVALSILLFPLVRAISGPTPAVERFCTRIEGVAGVHGYVFEVDPSSGMHTWYLVNPLGFLMEFALENKPTMNTESDMMVNGKKASFSKAGCEALAEIHGDDLFTEQSNILRHAYDYWKDQAVPDISAIIEEQDKSAV